MQNQHGRRLLFVTIGIYSLTGLFHLGLQLNGGSSNSTNQSLLGIAMVIPVLVVIISEKIFWKGEVLKTFGISFKWNGWYLFAIFLPIFMGVALYVTAHIFQATTAPFSEVANSFLTLFFIGLTIASLSAFIEEVVWRGYFFHYTKEWGFFKSAFIIAVIWSLWHLPVALFYRETNPSFIGGIVYVSLLFFLSFLISYLRYRSQSVVAAALFHGMINVFYLSNDLFKGFDDSILETFRVGICTGLLVLLVAVDLLRSQSLIK